MGMDKQGNVLFEVKKRNFTCKSPFVALAMTGAKYQNVSRRHGFYYIHTSWGQLTFTGGVTMEAFFHDPHTGQDLNLILDGDWMGYGGNITVGEGGPVIAQMQREFRERDFFGGQTVSLAATSRDTLQKGWMLT